MSPAGRFVEEAAALGSRYEGYTSCVVCSSRRLDEIVSIERMEHERVFRERHHRAAAPDAPAYMVQDRAYPTQSYPARILACAECGTLARDPQPSSREVLDVYASDSYHRLWLEMAHREYRQAFVTRRRELVRRFGCARRVLEVGSFVGGFLAAARSFGWQAQGVDVGRCVVAFTKSLGLDVRAGTLDQARLRSRAFDAVFIWFCFDQIAEPWRALREIRRILVPGGAVMLRVPNGRFVRQVHRAARVVRGRWLRESADRLLAVTGLAAFPFRHGYTPAGLSRMLEASGFGAIDVRKRGTLRDPGRAAGRLLGPWIEVSAVSGVR